MKMTLSDFQKKRLEQELSTPDLSSRDKMRIQIMLLYGQGKSQKQICDFLNCAPVTARTWIHIVKSEQAHRWRDFCQDGRPKMIEDHHRDRLIELFKQRPKEVGYPFKKWTSVALQKQLLKEFEIEVSARHINRVLNEAGFSTRTQCPLG
jgi:transposase